VTTRPERQKFLQLLQILKRDEKTMLRMKSLIEEEHMRVRTEEIALQRLKNFQPWEDACMERSRIVDQTPGQVSGMDVVVEGGHRGSDETDEPPQGWDGYEDGEYEDDEDDYGLGGQLNADGCLRGAMESAEQIGLLDEILADELGF
jgi:hypothetical protein